MSSDKITTSGYTYDNSGNTTADPSGMTFTYDAENKQTQVSNGGTLGQYLYDGDGKRIKKYNTSPTDNRLFIYDAAGNLIEERSTTGQYAIQTSYVYAGSRLLTVEHEKSSTTSYLTADHLGSPRINTDGSGNVTSRDDYLPFGESITSAITTQRTSGLGYAADSVRKQFTGYERDGESGLDFAQARMFVPATGRFSIPDPILLSVNGLNPQSFNRYAYVLNNPIVFVDPLGLYTVDKDGNVIGDYDGECVGEMGACWDAKSGTWDFGGDKTPVGSEGQVVGSIEMNGLVFDWRSSGQSVFESLSGVSLSGNGGPCSQPPTGATPSLRELFINRCMKEAANSRVKRMDKERQGEMERNIVGAMYWSPIPAPIDGVFGSTTGFSIYPSEWQDDPKISLALTTAGMMDIKNLGPIGTAVNVLAAGGTEGLKAVPYNLKRRTAKVPTAEDRSRCEKEATQAGL